MQKHLNEYLKKQRQKEIEKTGIIGYCSCCGSPNKVVEGQRHDKECIWYPYDGGELGSTDIK